MGQRHADIDREIIAEGSLWTTGQIGDWAFELDEQHIWIRLPNGSDQGDLVRLPIERSADSPRPHPWWLWNGDREAPTLTPSILNRGAGDEWHGWMTAGVLVNA